MLSQTLCNLKTITAKNAINETYNEIIAENEVDFK